MRVLSTGIKPLIRRSPKKMEAKVKDGGERISPRKNIPRKDVNKWQTLMSGELDKLVTLSVKTNMSHQHKKQSGPQHRHNTHQTNRT